MVPKQFTDDPELRAFFSDILRTLQLIFEVTKGGQQATITTLALTDVSGTGDDSTINANIDKLETAVNGIRTALNTLGSTA